MGMCMFAEHTAPHIKTPVFALQSKYDSWQSDHVLYTKTDAMMNALGANITSRLQANLLSNPHGGAFLDGCYHHCGRWGEILPIDGDEQSTAFLKFYYGITEQTFWNQDVTYPCDKCSSETRGVAVAYPGCAGAPGPTSCMSARVLQPAHR